MFEVYSDGGCWPNPGPGGWAWILKEEGVLKSQGSGRNELTTNSRQELHAAIEGLSQTPVGSPVILYSDSQYVIKGLNEWRANWKLNGWMGVKNADLWVVLDRLVDERDVVPTWVRGHTGNPDNERCDQLATRAYREGSY